MNIKGQSLTMHHNVLGWGPLREESLWSWETGKAFPEVNKASLLRRLFIEKIIYLFILWVSLGGRWGTSNNAQGCSWLLTWELLPDWMPGMNPRLTPCKTKALPLSCCSPLASCWFLVCRATPNSITDYSLQCLRMSSGCSHA